MLSGNNLLIFSIKHFSIIVFVICHLLSHYVNRRCNPVTILLNTRHTCIHSSVDRVGILYRT